MKTLIIGSGHNPRKMVWLSSQTIEYEGEIVKLDINPDCNPDVIWDLRKHPLPFVDEEFDEIHAYHILEHLAQQGDYQFFFNEFNEYYRILKPGGMFFGVVPKADSKWAWGDPGHTRVFPREYLFFLSQGFYKDAGYGNPVSDYRYIYKGDFETIYLTGDDVVALGFILKKE